MDLYIASGRHSVTDDASRVEALDVRPDPDVVFVEAPDRRIGQTEYLVALVHAPLLVATAHLWQSVLLPLAGLAVGDDTSVDEHVAREHGADVVPVDVPHTNHVYDGRRLWALVNWVAVAWPLVAGVDPFSVRYLAALLFQGVMLFGAYVAATVPYRDRYMAARVADHAADYAAGCLVVGSGHHEAVARHLADHPQVEVLNPTRSTGRGPRRVSG